MTDPRVRKLTVGIIETQRRATGEMKGFNSRFREALTKGWARRLLR